MLLQKNILKEDYDNNLPIDLPFPITLFAQDGKIVDEIIQEDKTYFILQFEI